MNRSDCHDALSALLDEWLNPALDAARRQDVQREVERVIASFPEGEEEWRGLLELGGTLRALPAASVPPRVRSNVNASLHAEVQRVARSRRPWSLGSLLWAGSATGVAVLLWVVARPMDLTMTAQRNPSAQMAPATSDAPFAASDKSSPDAASSGASWAAAAKPKAAPSKTATVAQAPRATSREHNFAGGTTAKPTPSLSSPAHSPLSGAGTGSPSPAPGSAQLRKSIPNRGLGNEHMARSITPAPQSGRTAPPAMSIPAPPVAAQTPAPKPASSFTMNGNASRAKATIPGISARQGTIATEGIKSLPQQAGNSAGSLRGGATRFDNRDLDRIARLEARTATMKREEQRIAPDDWQGGDVTVSADQVILSPSSNAAQNQLAYNYSNREPGQNYARGGASVPAPPQAIAPQGGFGNSNLGAAMPDASNNGDEVGDKANTFSNERDNRASDAPSMAQTAQRPAPRALSPNNTNSAAKTGVPALNDLPLLGSLRQQNRRGPVVNNMTPTFRYQVRLRAQQFSGEARVRVAEVRGDDTATLGATLWEGTLTPFNPARFFVESTTTEGPLTLVLEQIRPDGKVGQRKILSLVRP